MKQIYYTGIKTYCYSNSISMLLESIGEYIPSSKIEVLTGVGIGSFWLPDLKECFFSNFNTPPDIGISNALNLLGFKITEMSQESTTNPPFKELKTHLKKSPVILGPLDMGYLDYSYFQEHFNLSGNDHYVVVYDIKKDKIYIHDPDGFPYIPFSLKKLKKAWRADSITYKRGYYRYWTNPRRIKNPSEKELYKNTLKLFTSIYKNPLDTPNLEIVHHHDAIKEFANHISKGKISKSERERMITFLFTLGSERANDFAIFFKKFNKGISDLKFKQAELFGECYVLAMKRNWIMLSKKLKQLANVENKFRLEILKC